MVELNKIYNTDCYEFIKNLPPKSIDLVVTDAPYLHNKGRMYDKELGMGKSKPEWETGRNGGFGKNGGLYNCANKMLSEMSNFTDDKIYALLDLIKPTMKVFNGYFFCSDAQVHYYYHWAEQNDLHANILVWRKPLSILNRNRFSQNLEYIVRIYDFGTGLNDVNMNWLYDKVCDDKPVNGNDKQHPCQKPISIFERFILLSSKENDVVLDPFVGSGTCALACLRNNRKFIGCELDEEFFKLATKRVQVELSQPTLF